jgi:hypothetical protein
VGGDAVPGDGDGTGGVQKGTKIKIQSEGAVVAKVEGCCQANGGSPGISCEMVRVACGLLISFSEIAFQGEKDVTSLPVPVKSVDVGVKWIFCRDLGNVGMIGLLVGAKIEVDGPISEGGNVVKDELKSMPFGITPSVLIGEFLPSPRIFLEGKSRKKKADPGKGEGFLCRIFITEGVQDQGGSGETGLDDGFQIRGKGDFKGPEKYPREKRGSKKREEPIHVLS